ncbi:MAG: asparagine synthase (glutamine-hydrolyzing) [Thermoleophilia bacterium]|nr:asparagine synthase (glutamine-hydrolyzing) [Thermoleophilia bacterium]
MCGIAGILDLYGRPVAAAELQAMSDVIRHRGPDDEGRWVDETVGLANRRLAIIDLSPAGRQPMANEDGSVLVAYNGEIYNYLELVPLLEARGHRFHSRTDTEVLVHAYEEWGPACVHRLNGMFAFAIWDARRRELFLARDRFGIKPLYYAVDRGRLVFGSEIKSLLAAGHPRRVSPEALNEYFAFQNLLSDRTLFDGVRLLPPGHTLTAGAGGLRWDRYWDLGFEPDDELGEEEWAERVRAAFERVVTRQLISDVPVGSYLSGGMDSGSIAAVASRHVPRLMTFTGGFDLSSVTGIELVFDERADAEVVSREFRTEHYEMVMHAGDMAWVLPELIWHLEDLRVGMCYQNYYIARLASKFVKVALAGTGGDELFAGYPWRYELVEDVTDPDEFDRLYYGYWTRLVPDAEKSAFFADDVFAEIVAAESPFDVYRETMAPVRQLDPVAKALYFEAKTFLHGLLLVEDRVSMAHSLEVRVPFLDDELVELAARIPARLKHADRSGKRLLRRAMAPLLPRELVAKPKQGFSPPDQSWYRGPTMDYIREILLDERTLARGWFKPEYVRRVLNEHLQGRVNHRLLIWSLLSFEWWNRLFLDGERAAVDARERWAHAR